MYKPYSNAVDWLNREDPFFTKVVLDMGAPRVIRGSDVTSARDSVILEHVGEADNPELVIYAEAFEECNAAEQAFLLAKMALHTLFQHISERDSDDFPDKRLLSDIHEAIVTDTLLDMFYTPPEDAITGPERFGVSLAGYGTSQAYEMLADEYEDLSDSDTASQYPGPLRLIANPDAVQGLMNGVFNGTLDGLDIPDTLESELGGIDELPSVAPSDGGGCSTALTSKSDLEMLAEANPGQVDWLELLLKVNPDLGKKPGMAPVPKRKDWTRRPNRFSCMDKSLTLPAHVPDRKSAKSGLAAGAKPRLVLALDLSGSIPRSAAEKMAELARMAPADKVEVLCCTFSTYYVEYDITSTRNSVAGGGTDFSAVEEFVLSTMKPGDDYPTVVCVTDGEASFRRGKTPSMEQLTEQWHWLPVFTRDAQFMRQNPEGYTGWNSSGRKIFHQILPFTLL